MIPGRSTAESETAPARAVSLPTVPRTAASVVELTVLIAAEPAPVRSKAAGPPRNANDTPKLTALIAASPRAETVTAPVVRTSAPVSISADVVIDTSLTVAAAPSVTLMPLFPPPEPATSTPPATAKIDDAFVAASVMPPAPVCSTVDCRTAVSTSSWIVLPDPAPAPAMFRPQFVPPENTPAPAAVIAWMSSWALDWRSSFPRIFAVESSITALTKLFFAASDREPISFFAAETPIAAETTPLPADWIASVPAAVLIVEVSVAVTDSPPTSSAALERTAASTLRTSVLPVPDPAPAKLTVFSEKAPATPTAYE